MMHRFRPNQSALLSQLGNDPSGGAADPNMPPVPPPMAPPAAPPAPVGGSPVSPVGGAGFAPGAPDPNSSAPLGGAPAAIGAGQPVGVDPAKKAAVRAQLLAQGFGGSVADGSLKLDSAAQGAKSPKYSLAQTAMDLGLGGKTEDLPVLLAELQKRDPRYKNFKIGGSKGDRLVHDGSSPLDPAFNKVAEIDAVLSAGEGGKGWAFQDVRNSAGLDPAGGAGPVGAAAAPSAGGANFGSLMSGGDPMAQIQAAIAQYAGKGGEQQNLQALLQQLGA